MNGQLTAAFDKLYLEQRDAIYRYALIVSRDADDAEDITQDVFVRVRDAIDSGGIVEYTPASMMVYMKRIAINIILDRGREKVRYPTVQGVYDDYADSSPDMRLALETEEIKPHIHKAIAELPDEQRVALVLYHFYDMPLKSIADVTDSPLGTVKKRLWSARKNLGRSIISFMQEV